MLQVARGQIVVANDSNLVVSYTLHDTAGEVPVADPERQLAAVAELAALVAAKATPAPFGFAVSGPTDRQGLLAPHARRSSPFTVRPLEAGHHSYRFTVRLAGADGGNSIHEVTGVVTATAVQPSYLAFPAIAASGVPELDLGNCYVDESRPYAQVAALAVENRMSRSLYLTASSNLAKQVFVFADEALTAPVADLHLPAKARATVFVALQPSIAADALHAGQCRILTGGVRIDVHGTPSVTDAAAPAPARRLLWAREVVKVRALIGQPSLTVTGPTFLDNTPLVAPPAAHTYHGTDTQGGSVARARGGGGWPSVCKVHNIRPLRLSDSLRLP